MFYKKGGGDIWSILTLNNVFFLGKMEKTRVAEGGFTYSHNIISIYHPKWWFFGEDQKCSWGPKMKNKPNFFFDNRGFPNWGGGGGPPLGNFSHIIPFFSLTTFLMLAYDAGSLFLSLALLGFLCFSLDLSGSLCFFLSRSLWISVLVLYRWLWSASKQYFLLVSSLWEEPVCTGYLSNVISMPTIWIIHA